MSAEAINRTRYRTLRAALLLVGLVSAAGIPIVFSFPDPHPLEWIVLVASALATAALYAVAAQAQREGAWERLQTVAALLVGLAAFLVLERVVWALHDALVENPGQGLFRPAFSFVPFLFLVAVAVLRARVALRMCWGIWGAVTAITCIALARYTGLSLQAPGEVTLLVWLVAACPLFIVLLHALPHYEEALDRSEARITEMRGQVDIATQLTESERRFNLVVDGLQVGVWDRWMEPEERRWWSPRFYELIGYTPEELPPTEEALKGLLHPEDRDTVWKEGTEQLRRGDIMDIDFRVNTRHRGYRWFNSHAKAQRDPRGRIMRLAGAITDIHDQRVAEEALQQAKQELTRLAYRDTTTGLNNRRAFDEHFYSEWQRAVRYGRPLSLLLIDLDHFKAYNDRKGHAAGDDCLARVARCIQDSVRKAADFVARIGGEEFAVILPETAGEGAMEVARKVHGAVHTLAIAHPGSPLEIVTVSIGVSSMQPPTTDTAPLLFEQADKALYHVKRCGRDDVLHIQTLAPVPGAAA